MAVGKDSVRTKNALVSLKDMGCDVVFCDMLDVLCNSNAALIGMKAVGARADMTKFVGGAVIGAYSVDYSSVLTDFYNKIVGTFTSSSTLEYLWDNKGVKVHFNTIDADVSSKVASLTATQNDISNAYNLAPKPIANDAANPGLSPFCGSSMLSVIGSNLDCLTFNQYQSWSSLAAPSIGTFQSWYFDDKISSVSVLLSVNETRALTETQIFISSQNLFPVLCSFHIRFPSTFNLSAINTSSDVSSPNFQGSGEFRVAINSTTNLVQIYRRDPWGW